MAASEREARSLVQHLSDQAGLCVADVAALARVTCNDTRVEARFRPRGSRRMAFLH